MNLATLASRLKGCVVKSDTVLTALCPCCSKAMTVRAEAGEVRFKCYGRHCGQAEIEQALSEGGGNSEIPRRDVASITSGTSVAAPQADDGWSGASQSEDKGGGRHDGQSERIGRTASVEEDRPDVAAAPVESGPGRAGSGPRPGPSSKNALVSTGNGKPSPPPQWEVDLYHIARGMVHSADTVYTIDELKFALEYAAFSRPEPRFKGAWHPVGMAEKAVKERIAELVDAAIDEEAFDKGPRRHPKPRQREPGEEAEAREDGQWALTTNHDGRLPVRSVYDLDAQPALTALRVYEADEFFAETQSLENITWLWDRIAPSCGLIAVFGDPEAGKSTFCRSWALSAASGQQFLGRDCLESKVLYLDLANEKLSHRRSFQKLGWSSGNLKLVSEDSLIGHPNGFELVENAVNAIGAKVVFVDMMADLLRFKDMNDYASAKQALRGLRVLCQRTQALFVVLHHTPKALSPDADVLKAGLGSQAIVAAFDLRMAIRRRAKDLSTLLMSNGKVGGEPLTEELVLMRNTDNEWISEGQGWGRARSGYYLDKVVAFLVENRGEKLSATAIAEGMGLNPGWIRGALAKAAKEGHLVRAKSGRFFIYWAEEGVPTISQADVDPVFKWGKTEG